MYRIDDSIEDALRFGKGQRCRQLDNFREQDQCDDPGGTGNAEPVG